MANNKTDSIAADDSVASNKMLSGILRNNVFVGADIFKAGTKVIINSDQAQEWLKSGYLEKVKEDN